MGMINAKENVPMKNHTTLKIGGPARRFFEPETIEDMAQILQESLEEEAPQVEEILKREMEAAADLSVRLEIDMNRGKSWYEAH